MVQEEAGTQLQCEQHVKAGRCNLSLLAPVRILRGNLAPSSREVGIIMVNEVLERQFVGRNRFTC